MILRVNLESTRSSNRLNSKRDVEKVEGIQQGATEMIKGLEKIGARNYLA